MNNRNHQSNIDPWDPDFYETGSTKPPKSYGGIIAILLAVVIFLGGIASVVGFLNIRLVSNIKNSSEEAANISFHNEDATASADASIPETTPRTSDETPTLELNASPSSPENLPQKDGLSLQTIYDQTINSVVSITCGKLGSTSTGTGVVLTEDGYLVTNAHVVDGAQAIQVLFSDGRNLPATLIGADAVSDLAVLHVHASDLTPAQFGDSSVLRVGDAVVAIGDPMGIELRGTMTDGIVSAINRNITTGGRTMTLIQTNAALNSGNSGGPLINCYGQVVGINTMKIGSSISYSSVEGLGFAIPSTTVKDIVDQLMTQGYVSGRPTLGITGESVPRYYELYYHFPSGLYITEVDESSQAYQAGIVEGDILISVDGTPITDMDSLNTLLYGYQAGDTVTVIIFRSGHQGKVDLVLGEAKS